MIHFWGDWGVIFVGNTLNQVADNEFLSRDFQTPDDTGSISKDFLSTDSQEESSVDSRVLNKSINLDSTGFWQ